MVADNHLNRGFSVAKPNLAWVTDITYICTQEGWLFLAVVLDLYSRSVVGWSMSDRINTDLALGALTKACWRRRDHAGEQRNDKTPTHDLLTQDRSTFGVALFNSLSVRKLLPINSII
jgi:transposase InsO family protein